jgi:hypothetical protein
VRKGHVRRSTAHLSLMFRCHDPTIMAAILALELSYQREVEMLAWRAQGSDMACRCTAMDNAQAPSNAHLAYMSSTCRVLCSKWLHYSGWSLQSVTTGSSGCTHVVNTVVGHRRAQRHAGALQQAMHSTKYCRLLLAAAGPPTLSIHQNSL